VQVAEVTHRGSIEDAALVLAPAPEARGKFSGFAHRDFVTYPANLVRSKVLCAFPVDGDFILLATVVRWAVNANSKFGVHRFIVTLVASVVLAVFNAIDRISAFCFFFIIRSRVHRKELFVALMLQAKFLILAPGMSMYTFFAFLVQAFLVLVFLAKVYIDCRPGTFFDNTLMYPTPVIRTINSAPAAWLSTIMIWAPVTKV
jgi:hypothetical protein